MKPWCGTSGLQNTSRTSVSQAQRRGVWTDFLLRRVQVSRTWTRFLSIFSVGGLGTSFHQHLFPTTSIISGPWSLWAPKFGALAVDYNRLRDQTRAFADVIAAVQPLSKQQIAGNYTEYRQRRAAGARWAVQQRPPVFAANQTALNELVAEQLYLR